MSGKVYNVLFLCTGNSARSIIGEALINALGHGRFAGYSAGSQPKGRVHPMALDVLRGMGFPAEGLRSKSWDEFSGSQALQMDFIFTVCGNAAEETCPVWPGHPTTAHWGIDDPAAVEGEGQHEAFLDTLRVLRRRIELFIALPFESLDRMSMANRLREIAGSPAETGDAR